MTLILSFTWRLLRRRLLKLLRCARLDGSGRLRGLNLWWLRYSYWIIIIFFKLLLIVLLTCHWSDQGQRCRLLIVWRISVQRRDTSIVKLGVGSCYLRQGLHLRVGIRFVLSGRGSFHTGTSNYHIITCSVGVRRTILSRRITWLLLLSSCSRRTIPLSSHWRFVLPSLNLLLILWLLKSWREVAFLVLRSLPASLYFWRRITFSESRIYYRLSTSN